MKKIPGNQIGKRHESELLLSVSFYRQMDPWRKKKNSCKLAAESWAVKQKSCVGLGICVILSPGSVRKARGHMPATFYPRKGKKRTQKSVWDVVDFFFSPLLELHDVEMRSTEPRKGSPSN